MDQTQAPVLDTLAALHDSPLTAFAPPGHRQGRGTDPRVLRVLGGDVFRADVLATGGLDDRTASRGILELAQRLMAEAVGAGDTFFSTCGSSLSVKAAMLAVAGPHQHLVVGRDAHKAVVSGLILAGIRPLWADPQWDADLNLAHPPSPEAFDRAFRAHPDARGALVTSPTPYGTCADLAAVAEVCHRYGRPLIVDEAWGAHLPFHPDLPRWAMDAGADVCVTSVHKMGSGLEQSSVFHLQGDLVDPSVLEQRADLLATTSPSVLVYAALDGWRRQMVQDGRRLYDDALTLAEETRARIDALPGLHVHGRADFCGPGLAADLDPLQIVVDLSALRISGYLAGDWLRSHHRITLHLCDHRRISAQLTHADDRVTTAALLDGVRELVDVAPGLGPTTPVLVPDPADLRLEQVMLPRDAFFGTVEQVPVDKAAGRIAAEMLTPYPPGIPAALPGERLTADVLTYLRTGVDAGMLVPDAADAGVETVRVAVEEPDRTGDDVSPTWRE
ncbi:aminotransferase class I/II-fold pyridoxal phosphate-dependent enzyme [Kitasatospora camelliae]|uniref:Ornithine decarboxylase n=1 Tax=Kitasatospora camelliae TaxID=3156397 RepID=A0AAU8JPQ7_9ACTN